MVGTARSKGCVTCLRRKVKCDENKPLCLRCFNSRLTCEGYERDRRWVDEGPKLQRALIHGESSDTLQSPVYPAELESIPSSLPPLARAEDDIYVEFLRAKLFDGYSFNRRYNHALWITKCAEAESVDVSNLSMRGLAAVYFARMHGNQKNVMDRAATLYGRAIRRLTNKIEDPDRRGDPANTSAAMALNLYEIIAYTSEIGWVQHAGGIARLIEMRGPRRYQEYPEHGHFLLSRQMIIMQAGIHRKASFLGTEEWRTIPWAKHPETKDAFQQVLDVGAQSASLVEEINSMENVKDRGEDVSSRREDLIERLERMVIQLIYWRWAWEDNNSNSVEEKPSSPDHKHSLDREGKPLFESILRYSNITLAIEILWYNCAVMTLRYLGKCLGRGAVFEDVLSRIPEENRPEAQNPLKFPYGAYDHLDPVLEICRSVEYCLEEHQACIGAFSLICPLRLVVISLALNDGSIIYRQWISDILDKVASESGFQLMRRAKFLPPWGADQDLPSGAVFQAISDDDYSLDKYSAYLSPAGAPAWK